MPRIRMDTIKNPLLWRLQLCLACADAGGPDAAGSCCKCEGGSCMVPGSRCSFSQGFLQGPADNQRR